MQGVYAITNLYDGQATAYVGASVDISARWKAHKGYLHRGKHQNRYLQRAWDKWGEAAFEWHIIEEVADSEEIGEREQHWLERYRESGRTYNMAIWVDGNQFIASHHEPRSKEIIQAMRKAAEKKQRAYPALFHPETGQIIPAGRGIKPLCRKYGFTRSSLRKIINGKGASCQGWFVLDTYESVIAKLKEKHRATAYAAGQSLARPYPALIHKDTGEIIPAGRNLSALARQKGLVCQNLWAIINGRRKSHRGWTVLEEQYEAVG